MLYLNKTQTVTIIATFVFLLIAAASMAVAAEKFPSKTVTVIIPFAAGGSTDLGTRVLASIAEKNSGVPWICKNVTGGAAVLGMEEMLRAKPDGYTIMMMTSNISLNKHLGLTKLSYEDYQPILGVHSDYLALVVRTGSPDKTLQDFLATAKQKRLKVQTGQAGGSMHIALLALQDQLGVVFNIIPSQGGGGPATTALLGEHVDAIFTSVGSALSGINSGSFKVLAVLAPERSNFLPDVPTVKELGYALNFELARAYYAPKDTPKEIVAELNAILTKAVQDETFVKFVQNSGGELAYRNVEEVKKYLAWELEAYKELLKAANMLK